jgi:hypothetical protein
VSARGLEEGAVLAAMRAWRRGTGPLLPWFRATPFSAACHYRDRALPLPRPGPVPGAIERLVASLPSPRASVLWVFDAPGPTALWLAFALRRRHRLASALCWNGWYDPRGVLDGREEIPLLAGLAPRLAPRADAGVCLVFDARRSLDLPAGDASDFLDNRYALGDEDAPSVEQIRAAGWRRVHAWSWGEPAKDLQAFLEYVERDLPVRLERDLAGRGQRG